MDEWLSYRGYIWQKTIGLLEQHWFLGYGPGTLALNFPQSLNPRSFGSDYIDRPHNLYLQIAYDSGNLAAILFIAWVGAFCWTVARSGNPRSTAVLAGVVGYLVASLVDDPGVGVAPIFWVLLGAGFGCL